MKLAETPSIPACLSIGIERLDLLVGGEDRAAHQPVQVVAAGNQFVEPVEIGPDLVERLVLEREVEKRGGITPRHARQQSVVRLPLTL